MEYWEFLLQKEGERSWQPLKSKKIEVEPGRYRVVAHSSRTNADVEICVTYTSTEEVPPKRRSQKRSRRTNSEGLMVVIPFTYLKPGVWELRCCSDIMSDFLGKSWQNAIQLQVLAKPTAVLATDKPSLSVVDTTPSTVFVDSTENLTPNPELAVEAALIAPETPLTAASAHPEPENSKSDASNNGEALTASTLESKPGIPVPKGDEEKPLPVTFVDVDTLIPLPIAELDEDKSISSSNSADVATPSNPILEQSLQMLEQILQQVLDPVLQELDESESSESAAEALEEIASAPSENPEWQGLTLTLKEDAYTARRGEALAIAGIVDVLDVNPSNGKTETLNSVFRGGLRYQLRDPQSSQLLLDVQHPLPEQEFPIAFSHTLEIPPDCKTRLILGKITLYSSSFVALTSQPFTITADLDELLESIIPGTKVMPVAKMLVLANNFASLEDNEALSQFAEIPLEPVVLDLIDTRPNPQSRPLEPATQKPFPPQLYQPVPTPKGSKSLNLPNFPKMPSAAASVEVSADEVKPEDVPTVSPEIVEPLDTVEDISSSQLPEAVQLAADDKEEATVEALDTLEFSALLVSVDDAPADSSEVLKEAADITSLTDSQVDDLDGLEFWDTPELEPQAESVQPPEPTVDEPAAVDNAFQALNIQDRFWLRLNSLAADAELSQWLQSDLSPPQMPTGVEGATQPNPQTLITEAEDVTSVSSEGLIADFDESIWAETDEFGNRQGGELEIPSQEERTSGEGEKPAPLTLVGVGDKEWAAQEIVVDDDEEQTEPELPELKLAPVENVKPPRETIRSSQPQVQIPAPVKFELPLPAPVLVVPTNELAVGEPVTVRIKLPPDTSARVCVKLWVQDRQSRALLDGPRWLMDLLPDGTGHLEAMTQLVVPFGCAEIRFEAIAMDLDSQRESHKVTLDCVVVPPDMPSMSLDEFET